MGTRMAPLLLLLLASCMASGGTGPTVQISGPEPPETGPAAKETLSSSSAAAGQSDRLPAIPRMRPEGSKTARAQQTSAAPAGSGADTVAMPRGDGGPAILPGGGRTAVSGSGATGGAAANGASGSGQAASVDSAVATAPASAVIPPATGQSAVSGFGATGGAAANGASGSGQAGSVDSAAATASGGQSRDDSATATLLPPRTGAGDDGGSASGGASGVVRAAAGQPAGRQAGGTSTAGQESATGGNEAVLLPGSGASARASDTPQAHETGGTAAAGAAASGAASTSLASEADLEDEQAVALLAPVERGIDVESLFDGDVVRYCRAMWQMGEYIGAARRRGEPFRKAIQDGVRRIASEKQLPLDKRLSFSGQVYGRLLYRLEDGHSARAFGAYVHFACLTVRGDKKIVPADPGAERKLNEGLKLCEGKAVARDDLNDCLFRELTPIVERRNG